MSKKLIEFTGEIDYPYTCAIVNNQIMGFLEEVEEPTSIELLDVSTGEGRRTYERTLAFLYYVSLKKCEPDLKIFIKNSVGDSLYGEIPGAGNDIIGKLREEAIRIANANKEIKRLQMTKESAIRKLEKESGGYDTNALRYLSKDTISIYSLEGYFTYFAGPLLHRTGILKVFDIVPFSNGFLILLPRKGNPEELSAIPESPKLFETINESKKWEETLEVKNAEDLNKSITTGKISNIIKIQEALHEKKIASIANEISQRRSKLVLIAGPSSSGKTTFAKKLEIQLRVIGLKPFTLSTDNYFIDRERTPLSENGTPDYDSFQAVDHELLEEHIMHLLNGEEVELSKYNFITGKQERGRRIKLDYNGVLVVEGIHSLNPELTDLVDEKYKFKVYVSVLTQINIDSINRVPTRDARLIRRIVRDVHFRGIGASETIRRWPTVINSEERNIFPYQENADVMFDSSLIYELALLRTYAEVPLRAIGSREKEYGEALRLLNFLSHFLPIMPDEIPPTSIVREFIGRSSFRY